jgi:acyl-CoA thioester hydrolase
MEQARVEWLESLRERVGDVDGQGQVIVKASCTFLLPLCYPGAIDVRMFLDPPGRSSLDSHYELWMNERKYAEGSARIVWIDQRTQRSAPLPERLRAICA